MTVTLSEVKRAARAHRAPLAGESAGYLVLALADQVLSAPRVIDANDIQLTDDGGLRLLRGQASSETDAELSLRRALDGLLLVASSGSAALMRAGRRESLVGLPGLVRELEAALIPVNRAAARRALARLHRETARALASGVLPEEEPGIAQPSPACEARAPEVAEAAESPEPETLAIVVPVAGVVDLPSALTKLAGAQSALGDVALDASSVGDELTIALDLRPAETVLLDEDVELIEEEAYDALTVVRNVEVEPLEAFTERALVDLPEEACTRPEPIIVRQAQRSAAASAFAAQIPEVTEALARTPTLGSLAAELPVLAPELIAELTRREVAAETAEAKLAASARDVEKDEVVCSLAHDEYTEPMPDVAPLSPAVALVASRKSDVSELLADFQVGPAETHQGLRRAIKELAELDLTPAPFAALIR